MGGGGFGGGGEEGGGDTLSERIPVAAFPVAAPSTRALSPRARPRVALTPAEHRAIHTQHEQQWQAAVAGGMGVGGGNASAPSREGSRGPSPPPSPRELKLASQRLAAETDRHARARAARADKALRDAASASGAIEADSGMLAPWGSAVYGEPIANSGKLPACTHSERAV